MSYVFVGPHPDTLADGTPLGLDQEIANTKVDLNDPHDRYLVDEGYLVKQEHQPRSKPDNKSDDEEKKS